MKTFDLTTVYNETRPMSWSAISSFEWNKQQWYRKYVLGELPEETPEMRFGKMVDKKVQDNPTYLPELVRYPIQQHEMRTTWKRIPLLGFSDQYRPVWSEGPYDFYEPLAIRDLKTGRKAWDQKRADETGQLTMYLFMLYLQDKKIRVADAELYIDWIPTHIDKGQVAFIEPVKIHTFKTKRTMLQVLQFGQRIEDTWKEMEAFATREASLTVHSREDW